MDEIVKLIENIVNNLFDYNMEQYVQNAQALVNTMMESLPTIIAYYYDSRMSDIASDALYWPSQMDRIINVLEQGDDFATIDVLYCETRMNLLELKTELANRGVV